MTQTTTRPVGPTWVRFSRPAEGLVLRPARPTDALPLAALKRRVETASYAHLGSPEAFAVRLRERCSAWHLLSLLGEGHLLLTAALHGDLAGLAAARVEVDEQRLPALRLHSAYVERPGLGVGRALTAARLLAGAELGLERVVASSLVGARSAGRRLRNLGLRPAGPSTPCATYPGVGLAHWEGDLATALARALDGAGRGRHLTAVR